MRTKLAALALGTALVVGVGLTQSQPADAQDQSEQTRSDRMLQREERLQSKVDEGLITQERADEIRARMADKAERREARQAARAERTEDLAATLATTAEELIADLRSGTSLAELAQAAGVDVEALIDQIETQRITQIEQAVVDGHIDQARADEKLEGLRDRITARVNGERGDGHRHRRGGN